MRRPAAFRALWEARAVVLFGTLAQIACASGSTATTSSGSAASSTGSPPEYLDSGTCLNNQCQHDTDCCSGFACNTVDGIDECCELPTAATLDIPCQLDTDCCPIVGDGGSNLPYCNNGICGIAPTCAPLGNPCAGGTCCQTEGAAFCNSVNGLCTLQEGTATTGSSTGGSSTGGTTGTTGGGTSSGSSGGSSTGGTGGSQTNWVFSWTFGVNEACEQAGMGWVEIQLSGSTVGLFPCRDQFGTEGATVAAPPLQQASYALTGYDPAGLALAQSAGTTPVAMGATSVPVDFTLNAGGPSNLDLGWTFAGQTCSQAGVTQVQVTLTDPNNSALDVNETVPCSASGQDGLALTGYGAGQFPLALSATGADGGYQATASVSSNGLSDSLLQIDLLTSSAASSGDVQVHFDFGGESCLAAGLDSVGLQLSTIRGTALAPAVVLPCDAGSDYLFAGVPAPATGFLWVEGISQGQTQQLSNPQVVVSPGGTASYSVVTQLGN